MNRVCCPFNRVIMFVAILFICNSCCTTSTSMVSDTGNESAEPAKDDLFQLVSLMTGSFSSKQQSLEDKEFFDIRLQMVRIWPHQPDGYWLYIEQAVATHLEKPYRQRIYHVTQSDDGTFRSAVYTFAEPLRFAGVYKEKDPLADLSPADLEERKGCVIVLKKEKEKLFSGSTVERDCESSLRGATYATSKVTITPEELYSWDQGFDAEGKQVWGAVKEGYHFLKIEDYPL